MNEKANQIPENKMGVMPVGKLVFNMSVPMMVSMLVQALYNVVDSIFVSHLSENAFTAVSLAFPLQMLMIAVSTGTAVGINALLSRALGARNPKRAQAVGLNGVFLAMMSMIAFVFIGAFVSPVFFRSQTDVEEILTQGIQYLTICCCCSQGLFFAITFERLLQSTGRTIYTMFTQGLGAIVNIILDPIMIFGLFGCPKMGVAGAALATVIGQFCGMFLALAFCLTKNPEIPLNFRGFRPSGELIRDIYRIGVPSIVMQAIGSVMVYGLNRILIPFTTTAAAVFGAYFKLQSFVFMPVFGLNNGVIPIVAYNYGARNKDRIMKAFKVCLGSAACIMVLGVLLFQFFPDILLGLFDPTPEMLSIGIPALRIISINFPMAAVGIVCSGIFQALGNSFLSMIVSIARQLVLLLPAAWLLSLTGTLDLVWFAFPIAEIFSLVLTIFLFRWTYKKHLAPLGGEKDGRGE
jgi:putative MATE family efflux protein